MLILLAISSLLSLIVACVLGIRLIRLSLRTGGIPERSLGLGYFVGGFVGFAMVLVATPGMTESATEATLMTFRIGFTLINVGIVLTYVFVWKTFQADSRVAAWVVAAATTGIALSLYPIWTAHGARILLNPFQIAGDCLRAGGLLWGTCEALRYHAAMRRRLALGLADPIVTNRFLLWGLACMAGVVVTGASAMMTISGEASAQSVYYAIIGLFSFVSPSCQWLAFFPPSWYRARIAAGAVAA